MRVFLTGVAASLLCAWAMIPVVANEPGSATRADAELVDEPLFSRHVIPLFSRLGCNAGGCHGKVKGENGFRLSLFGVDPAADHASLTREFAGRRVNLADPEASLLLLKPSGGVSHGGGKLFDPGSPEHRLLRAWLERGAPLDPREKSQIERLVVTPQQRTIPVGETYPLKVEVHFRDGGSEDVTRLCRFEPVDGDVAEIDARGIVTAKGIGDTAIVVRYGAEPAVAMAMVPGTPVEFPQVAAHDFIDEHILAKLRALNVPPAESCDDATFLRRASLDLAGGLPDSEEVRGFLADQSPDKRAKKIDELLERPGHTALWATKLCDILKPSGYNANYALVEPAENRRVYDWVRARLTENVPYDQLAERILTATSQEGRSYEEWIEEALTLAEENAREARELPAYASRHTLDLYWQRERSTGVKGAIQVSHAFLGLRMECAECHRHPHDIWSQDDLLSFANFFNQLKGARSPDKKAMPEAILKMFEELPKQAKELDAPLKELRDKRLKEATAAANKARDELNRARNEKKGAEVIEPLEQELAAREAERDEVAGEIAELEARRGRMTNGPKRFGTDVRHDDSKRDFASVSSPLGSQKSETFRLLGDDGSIDVPQDQDPRPLVVEWLRRPDNPFFAKAIVNRVWAHYFGRGIVDPPDHLSPLNPPSHPELLDELCRRFIAHKYDLRWLHRTIANSRAYQQSSTPATVDPARIGAARRNFGAFELRRLPAEALVDAIDHATGTVEEFPAGLFLPEQAKAIEVAGVTSYKKGEAPLSYAFRIFGRPTRDTEVQCDCERDANATIVQTLYLANHPRVLEKIYGEGRVTRLLEAVSDDDARIDELYLATLTRLPNDGERAACLDYVQGRESSPRAFQDVLWSLLNTREFVLNH
ncbi:MAG: DUF1553 domain-containing protein [Planctomycetaceae bacterium]